MRAVWIGVGFVLGTVTVLGIAAAASGPGDRAGPAPKSQMVGCAVTLVLVAPADDQSLIVDRITGGGGFSHAYLESCEVDEHGNPLAIDCQAREGIYRATLSDVEHRYRGRDTARVVLTGTEAAELYGCARSRVGERFELLDVLAAAPDADPTALYCTGFLAGCLPARLRQIVSVTPAEGTLGRLLPNVVSPNRLARAFGARLGEVVQV